MTCVGEVKSFIPTKGWGFITCEEGDVFVHMKDCTDGMPKAGDAVTFDLEEDPVRAGQKKALNVVGCTGSKDEWSAAAGGGKGGWGKADAWGGKGAWGKADVWGGPSIKPAPAKPALAAPIEATGTCEGVVKSFNHMKGWGFIVYEG